MNPYEDWVRRNDGLFVGQLTDPEEMQFFRDACKAGYAQKSYEGAAGFMGLAKIRAAKDSHD